MDRVKTFRKYIIWVIAFYFFSMLITYIGLNARYNNIENVGELPGNVKVAFAQATSVNGRILGEITSNESNNLNGKYLKVDIFSKRDELIGTKYLKLDNLNQDKSNKFAVYFSAQNVKKYTLDILDSSEDVIKNQSIADELYKKIFLNEDLKTWLIVTLIVYAIFS